MNCEFDDLQIDAHGFSPFRSHKFACLPSLSTNFPPNELVLINGLTRSGSVEQERSVFDLKGYRKVRALGYSILEFAMANETPRAGLGEAESRKGKRGSTTRVRAW